MSPMQDMDTGLLSILVTRPEMSAGVMALMPSMNSLTGFLHHTGRTSAGASMR